MADEKKADEKPGDKGPQPGVDADAIKVAVTEGVSSALSNWTPPQPEPRESERRSEPTPSDPLANIIGAHVNPALRQMGYEIADAKDAALFYVEHPEMLPHKAAIEEAFNRLKQQGTPMARVAVSDWYKGKNFDEFRKTAEKAEKLAAERARDAADTGGGVGRERTAKPADPYAQSDEELAKTLEGVAF